MLLIEKTTKIKKKNLYFIILIFDYFKINKEKNLEIKKSKRSVKQLILQIKVPTITIK